MAYLNPSITNRSRNKQAKLNDKKAEQRNYEIELQNSKAKFRL